MLTIQVQPYIFFILINNYVWEVTTEWVQFHVSGVLYLKLIDGKYYFQKPIIFVHSSQF